MEYIHKIREIFMVFYDFFFTQFHRSGTFSVKLIDLAISCFAELYLLFNIYDSFYELVAISLLQSVCCNQLIVIK